MRTIREKILHLLADVIEKAELEAVVSYDYESCGKIYVQNPTSLAVFGEITFNFQKTTVNFGVKTSTGYVVPRDGLLIGYTNNKEFVRFLGLVTDALSKHLSQMDEMA